MNLVDIPDRTDLSRSGRTHNLSRRPLGRLLAAVLAVGLMSACASSGQSAAAPSTAAPLAAAPTAAGVSPTAGGTTFVMIIRHGEKPAGSDLGYDAQGNENPAALTKTGWERATKLADLFDPAQGDPRRGLARPAAIYAANANDEGEGLRTRETVTPLADRLGIPVNTAFGKTEEQDLVALVTGQPGPALISWQHGEIPDIAEQFPGVSPTPPSEWPDDRFDVVWTFTKTSDGWRFDQVPERVLPQDQDLVISDGQ